MLSKFGFRAGAGLGKTGQGISRPLMFEQTTEGAGRIVNIDKDDPNIEHTMVPILRRARRDKSRLSVVNFVPAPENGELRPLPERTEEDEERVRKIQEKYMAQWMVKEEAGEALATPASSGALPVNPYFKLKKNRTKKTRGRDRDRS